MHYFRTLTRFRHANPVLRRGSFTLVDNGDSPILAYWREHEGRRCLVAANTAAEVQEFALPGRPSPIYQSQPTTIVKDQLVLPGYAIWIGEIQE
ncbi:MAG: alpha-glucosidase C-terminal domain-containing protein [Anaerolineales bacterium]|nr:alpha-glucosidase C-terminal domain-containing protein [Anaerolineales bacterium]